MKTNCHTKYFTWVDKTGGGRKNNNVSCAQIKTWENETDYLDRKLHTWIRECSAGDVFENRTMKLTNKIEKKTAMGNITTTNYAQTSSAINWAGAPEALKNGKTFFDKVTKNGSDLSLYQKSEGIQKTIDLYLDKLNEYAGQNTVIKDPPKKPTKTLVKPKPISTKATPAPTMLPTKQPTMSPAKKVARKKVARKGAKKQTAKGKTITLKRSKAKVRKVAAQVVKAVRKSDQAKVPVTVNKKSLELQLIGAFANMHGKTYKSGAILSKYQSLKNHFAKGTISDHKAILQNILTRLGKAKTAVVNSKATSIKITLDTGFRNQCISLVKNAKPKLQVNYLSGVKSKSVPNIKILVDGNKSTLHELIKVNNQAEYEISQAEIKKIQTLKPGQEIYIGMVAVKRDFSAGKKPLQNKIQSKHGKAITSNTFKITTKKRKATRK